jgi:hypothetical protein
MMRTQISLDEREYELVKTQARTLDTFYLLFRRLFSKPPVLLTSAVVVAEWHGWFLRRYDQYRAMQFLALLSELPVLWPQDWNLPWEAAPPLSYPVPTSPARLFASNS